jgi:hypothetical protein
VACASPASYNASVPYALRFPLLIRGLLAALALLLSLGPFLHGHLGASHVTGFHLDKVDVVAHASAHDGIQAQPDQDSPAIGVDTSLSKDEKDSPADRVSLSLALLPTCIPAPTAQTSASPKPALTPSSAPLYAVGLPPPALAPPSIHV